ncbi:MAG: hypothetical protein JW893_06220 [Candidatus Omnitrophica bacterium]|nr:hypothetical protein [Candidatus Omnitrophota bacterium]
MGAILIFSLFFCAIGYAQDSGDKEDELDRLIRQYLLLEEEQPSQPAETGFMKPEFPMGESEPAGEVKEVGSESIYSAIPGKKEETARDIIEPDFSKITMPQEDLSEEGLDPKAEFEKETILSDTKPSLKIETSAQPMDAGVKAEKIPEVLKKDIQGSEITKLQEGIDDPEAASEEFQKEIEKEILNNPNVIFEFYENLSLAQATIIHRREGHIEGVWKNDRFVFPKRGEQDVIRVGTGSFKGVKRRGIYCHPTQQAIKRLRFLMVPPGKKLVIQYGIDDLGVNERVTSHVYLKIWVGEHELGRIQIANEKGWFKKVYPLGVVRYLKRPVVITFEVTADNVKGRHFFFKPEIQ